MRMNNEIRGYIRKKLNEKMYNSEEYIELTNKLSKLNTFNIKNSIEEQLEELYKAIEPEVKSIFEKNGVIYNNDQSKQGWNRYVPYIYVPHNIELNKENEKEFNELNNKLNEMNKKLEESIEDIIVSLSLGGTKEEMCRLINEVKF